MPQDESQVLAFNVVTGFLGAGKTTLLNAMLKHPDMDDALVIVNEFGDVGLDHLLVEASAGEVLELTSGCLCCALRGDLVETLIRVLQERDEGRTGGFRRIVVETSGLADPAPILHGIMAHPWLTRRLKLDGLVTVVDALGGADVLAAHPEAVKQAALADRLVISKADMLAADDRRARLENLRNLLRRVNPTAEILLAGEDACRPRRVLRAGLADAATGTIRLNGWLGLERMPEEGAEAHHSHESRDGGVESFAIVRDAPLSPSGLEIFIDLLRANFGAALLRVKGIAGLTGDPDRPVVIHGVQHVFHAPARLPAWPDADHRTRLVFIVRGEGVREKIVALFEAASDPLSGSGAALADDTLSLPPGKGG